MLHIVIEKGNKSFVFSEIFKKIKIFTDTLVINFNKEFMYIQGMDSSHIIVFELKIYSKWFETYVITKESNYEYGINTNIVSKILSVRDENQHIRLYQCDDDTDKLHIDFINISPNEQIKNNSPINLQNNDEINENEKKINVKKRKSKKKKLEEQLEVNKDETKIENKEDKKEIFNCYEKFFEIPLVDIDCEMLEIPPTDYDATLKIESKNIKNLIDNFALFESSTVDFTFNQEDISLKSSGIETNMEVNISHDQMEIYSITEDTVFTNSFSLKFLHNICQFSKISKIIQIQQSNKIPVEFTFMLDDENIFRIYLAPTINDYLDDEI